MDIDTTDLKYKVDVIAGCLAIHTDKKLSALNNGKKLEEAKQHLNELYKMLEETA